MRRSETTKNAIIDISLARNWRLLLSFSLCSALLSHCLGISRCVMLSRRPLRVAVASLKCSQSRPSVLLSSLHQLPRSFVYSTKSPQDLRYSSSSPSSTRWKARQAQDPFARDARVQGLKSRAAFKLLQINDKHRIFNKGDTVVDLGYAPGSWSQVAVNRTAPRGRVIGVDMIPAQPPRGVSTIQGDFLSPSIQAEVRAYVQDSERGRVRKSMTFGASEDEDELFEDDTAEETGYVDMGRGTGSGTDALAQAALDHVRSLDEGERMSKAKREEAMGRVVDVVLSDMSEPWEQTSGFGKKSISDPYHRMMSTSGIAFRDHAGSMVCRRP